LWREFEVASRLQQQRREQALMTGWFAAAYVWRKELPDLVGELAHVKPRRGGRRQTREEALFVMESLSARLGIPIQTRPPKGKA
jgi:hypothetical protein